MTHVSRFRSEVSLHSRITQLQGWDHVIAWTRCHPETQEAEVDGVGTCNSNHQVCYEVIIY